MKADREFGALKKTLAENLKRARRESKLSQEKLAFEANVNRTFVSEIERRLGNPSLKTLARLSFAVKRPLPELLAKSKVK